LKPVRIETHAVASLGPRSTAREQGTLLVQAWLSPAFPIGGYSYSHGLEYAVEAGLLRDRGGLLEWIDGVLRFGSGRNDAILLRESHWAVAPDDPERFLEIAGFASTLRGTAELALESTAQGEAFLKALAAGWPGLVAAGPLSRLATAGIRATYPVCFGAAAALIGVDARFAVLSYLQAFAANLVSAALRLMPIGQSDGLACLAALGARLPGIADRLELTPFEDIGSAAIAVDLCSMGHETQYPRLFRS
jgi:urease accessory protein